jgi:2-iminobutanoate/2-iminopropanoate deaminase
VSNAVVSTPNAPAPAGPYNQGRVVGNMLYLAGQGGFDPQDGGLVDGIAAQTERTIKNLEAVLEAAGASLADLVKVSVFLTDQDNFQAMNEVYARLIPEPHPVRTTAEVGLAPGMLVEIDGIAILES